MKASTILFSLILFVAASSALHIPARASIERREAATCSNSQECGRLVRRQWVPPHAMAAAGTLFVNTMQAHVLRGVGINGHPHANQDAGRHLLTVFCNNHRNLSGTCNTATHLCAFQTPGIKTLWDDRLGGHTPQDVSRQCTVAIALHGLNNHHVASYTVAGGPNMHGPVCIRYVPGSQGRGGTCYPAGINTVMHPILGAQCQNTGNVATASSVHVDCRHV